MEINTLVNKLKDRNISAVSRATGLSYRTVYNVAKQKGRKPHNRTIQKLTNYMEVN